MALALDGKNFSLQVGGGYGGNITTPQTITLTTSNANCILYSFIGCSDPGDSGHDPSLSDTAGLTWVKLAGPLHTTNGGGEGYNWVYIAKAPSALSSYTLTMTEPTDFGDYLQWLVFGVSGSNYSAPRDPYSGLANLGTLANYANGTITTTNSNDFLIGIYGSGGASTPHGSGPEPGAGWTKIYDTTDGFNYACGQYKIVSAAQSGTTVTATTGDSVVFFQDAITSDGGGVDFGVSDTLYSQVSI